MCVWREGLGFRGERMRERGYVCERGENVVVASPDQPIHNQPTSPSTHQASQSPTGDRLAHGACNQPISRPVEQSSQSFTCGLNRAAVGFGHGPGDEREGAGVGEERIGLVAVLRSCVR